MRGPYPVDKYRRYLDTDGMRTAFTREERRTQTRAELLDAAERCSHAGLPRHLGGHRGGRRRLHEGRRLLELRVEGGPLLCGLRAPRGPQRVAEMSGRSRSRDGARRHRAAHADLERRRRGRLARGLLRVLGARSAPPGAARALRQTAQALRGPVERALERVAAERGERLPEDRASWPPRVTRCCRPPARAPDAAGRWSMPAWPREW